MVHGDLAAMLIGGMSALLLQTLHPLAMAGVADHSSYQEDPFGRLRRTAHFVGTTTFGTDGQAEAAIAQVRRVHRRVKGIAPDGRPYSADDPDLVTFIHVAEVWSFLESSRRFGPRSSPRTVQPVLRRTGPRRHRPRGRVGAALTADVDDYFRRMRPELYASRTVAPGARLVAQRRAAASQRAGRVLAAPCRRGEPPAGMGTRELNLSTQAAGSAARHRGGHPAGASVGRVALGRARAG